MLSHVFVGVSDFERAVRFYAAIMAELGYPQKFLEPEKFWAGWKPVAAERPLFIVGRPFNAKISTPGVGQMVALLAPSRDAVNRCFATAIELGASSEGAPGLRPHYHENYYGGYFRDLDGNKICVVHHDVLTSANRSPDQRS